MQTQRLSTGHLDLTPLPVEAAKALPGDRATATAAIGVALAPEWPDPDLDPILRRHAASPAGSEIFGIWTMIERDSGTDVGDIGFHGPPDDGIVEIGYSVIPSRRRRGYATEAAVALVAWANAHPEVTVVVAGCDPDNAPSIATLERAGFHRTGTQDGELRWRHQP